MEKEFGKRTCEITHAFVPRSRINRFAEFSHRYTQLVNNCNNVLHKPFGVDGRRAVGDSIRINGSQFILCFGVKIALPQFRRNRRTLRKHCTNGNPQVRGLHNDVFIISYRFPT